MADIPRCGEKFHEFCLEKKKMPRTQIPPHLLARLRGFLALLHAKFRSEDNPKLENCQKIFKRDNQGFIIWLSIEV